MPASRPSSSITAASAIAPGNPTTSTRRCNWRTGARRSHTPAPCPASTPAGSRRSAPRSVAATRSRPPPRTRRSLRRSARCRSSTARRQAYRSAPPVQAAIDAAAEAGGHLPAVGQPHEAAFINAPGAEAGWRHVVSIGEDSRWRNRTSAGWLLGGYSPIRHAETLHCPWLVCVGEEDNVALPGPAIAAGRRAPKGEVRTYPGVAHFDIYDGPEHEAVVADDRVPATPPVRLELAGPHLRRGPPRRPDHSHHHPRQEVHACPSRTTRPSSAAGSPSSGAPTTTPAYRRARRPGHPLRVLDARAAARSRRGARVRDRRSAPRSPTSASRAPRT